MRDYAKKSRPAKRQPQSDGTWILAALTVCAVLFAGYVVYHFTHEKLSVVKEKITTPVKIPPHKIIRPTLHKKPEKQVKKVTKEVAVKKAKAVKKIKEVKVATLNPADIQPKYDFYKLLPAMTVSIPEQNTTLQTKIVPAAKTTASSSQMDVLLLQTNHITALK